MPMTPEEQSAVARALREVWVRRAGDEKSAPNKEVAARALEDLLGALYSLGFDVVRSESSRWEGKK